jgi:hypothetical protein
MVLLRGGSRLRLMSRTAHPPIKVGGGDRFHSQTPHGAFGAPEVPEI